MAKNVYLFPQWIAQSITYSRQNNVLREATFFPGGFSQATELTPAVRITIEGTVHRENHATWLTFMDRLAGGVSLFAITDRVLRARMGWDVYPAVNSSGSEFWIKGGGTAAYAGESAGATWRSIFAAANGAASADDTSIAVDGLLANEEVPAGTPARIGDWRYTVRTTVTANASGEATLQLGHPLRAAVSDNDQIRIPGDLAVFFLAESRPGAADVRLEEPFSLMGTEVYESEVTGGFTWVVDS